MATIQKIGRFFLRIIIYILIYVLIYYLLKKLNIYKPIIASPEKILKSLDNDFFDALKIDFLTTLLRWQIIFLIGSLSGIFLGILFGFLEFGKRFSFDIDFWRSLPATILVNYVIALLGDNEFSRGFPALYLTFFTTFFYIYKFCLNMDKTKIIHLRALNASKTFIIKNCIIYEMLPKIMTTARQVISLSFLILIATEMILGSSRGIGIGNRLVDWFQFLEYEYLTLFILIIGIVGYLANSIMLSVSKRVLFWEIEIN